MTALGIAFAMVEIALAMVAIVAIGVREPLTIEFEACNKTFAIRIGKQPKGSATKKVLANAPKKKIEVKGNDSDAYNGA